MTAGGRIRVVGPEALPAGGTVLAPAAVSVPPRARPASVTLVPRSMAWPNRRRHGRASVLAMVERPTAVWRQNVADDAAGIAAGILDPEEAVAAQLWPDDMIRDTDEVLDGFEADAAGLVSHRYEPAGDAEVFEVIERTVKALNAVNARYLGAAYETGERELLCTYIADALDDAGIDVDALAARHRMTRDEITDEWRHW
jgi:hypothetical protein